MLTLVVVTNAGVLTEFGFIRSSSRVTCKPWDSNPTGQHPVAHPSRGGGRCDGLQLSAPRHAICTSRPHRGAINTAGNLIERTAENPSPLADGLSPPSLPLQAVSRTAELRRPWKS